MAGIGVLRMIKFKSLLENIFLLNFEYHFLLAQKYCSIDSTYHLLSEMNPMFLESAEHTEWE